MKDSLIFYIQQYIAIKDLDNEQLGRLFRTIFEKQLGNEVVLDDDIKIAFNFINNQLVVDNRRYEEKIAKLTANAKKGGAPKGNQNAKKQLNNQNNQIEGVNVNDNVNVNVNVNDNVNVNKTKSKKNNSAIKTNRECGNVVDYIDTYSRECFKLPQIKTVTDSRKKAIGLFGKTYTLKDWEEVCKIANNCDFLLRYKR